MGEYAKNNAQEIRVKGCPVKHILTKPSFLNNQIRPAHIHSRIHGRTVVIRTLECVGIQIHPLEHQPNKKDKEKESVTGELSFTDSYCRELSHRKSSASASGPAARANALTTKPLPAGFLPQNEVEAITLPGYRAFPLRMLKDASS